MFRPPLDIHPLDIRSLDRRKFLGMAAALTLSCRYAAGAEAAEAARADVEWLKQAQTPPPNAPPAAKPAEAPLRPLLVDADGQAITTLPAWNKQRLELRRWWLDFLGPLAEAPRMAPTLIVEEEDRVGDVLRQRVRYDVEPGLTTEAYLLKPARPKENCPGAVVFHSTDDHSIRQPAGVEGTPEKAFGLRLAEMGFVALCPRNYLWPQTNKLAAKEEAANHAERHPRSKGMAKMLFDAQVAVDLLTSLKGVDPRRVAAVGHSLGAKEVLYLAAFDERITVTVSSEGGIGTLFSNWDAPWYLGPDIKDKSFSHEHHELLAMCAPRPFLLVGGDSADGDQSWPFIAAAMPVYSLYGAPPRLGLFNHRQGHAVPAEAERRIYDWIKTYA